jgi:hypothetical protein
MVREIAFARSQWEELTRHLLRPKNGSDGHQDEQLVFVLAGHSQSDHGARLVARDFNVAESQDFDHQSAGGLRPTAEFVAKALSRCRQEGWSLIEVHSHPFNNSSNTTFSGIDWRSDRSKMPVIATMLPPPAYHVTMVMGQASFDAHYFDRASGEIRSVDHITIIGDAANGPAVERRVTSSATLGSPFRLKERHLRQAPLLGTATQEILAQSTALVVGLGGLGSFASLELAHLGFGHLVLVDPDRVELTNLNRLVAAPQSKIGEFKVNVYAEAIAAIAPATVVTTYPVSILDDAALAVAKGCDILLGCVDSHGARLILNRLAVQFMLPLVDAGTGARRKDSTTKEWNVGGQVQAVLPNIGCLECRGFIDPARAAYDLASPEMQEFERDHGYGTGEPAPSVIYLNGVVASIQVATAVFMLASAGSSRWPGPIVLYDAQAQSLTPAQVSGNPNCPTCGIDGIVGLADLYPVFEREVFGHRPQLPSIGQVG